MTMTFEYDIGVKMVMLGDPGVGKSALFKRVADGEFIGDYVATIGVDFAVQTFDVDERKARLQVWDTAGQERFHNVAMAFCRSMDAVMLVYDVCDEESFSNIQKLHDQAKQRSRNELQMILIGNKSDIEGEDREVSYDDALALADSLNMALFETSAKDGTNVDQAFDCILRQSIKHKVNKPRDDPSYFENTRSNGGALRYGDSRGCCCVL